MLPRHLYYILIKSYKKVEKTVVICQSRCYNTVEYNIFARVRYCINTVASAIWSKSDMDTSLQKADIWKRISAFLCDATCIIFVSLAVMLPLIFITRLNEHASMANERREAIIKEAGYVLPDEVPEDNEEGGENSIPKENIYPNSYEEKNSLSGDALERYKETEAKILSDEVYVKEFTLFVSISLIIITFSILLSFLIFEFTIPLLFKNGQTLGKKVFGVAVMRADGVKITPSLLFLRAIVCKFTLETMVPIMALVAAAIFQWWVMAGILIIGILLLQAILLFFTKERTPIHDTCTYTVAVDMGSQKIFNTAEEKAEYIAKIQRELAEDYRDY